MPTFYEFFAGGGLARIGLGAQWRCLFANDISAIKAEAYVKNFGAAEATLAHCDINDLDTAELPGQADLIWGSFPCQDLSLAGAGNGLKGSRSGLIWSLLQIVERLMRQGRGPKMLVLENVTGLLNSRDGQDLYDILRSLKEAGFVYGMLLMDAIYFLPQSRPRIFLVAVDREKIGPHEALVNRTMRLGKSWSSRRLDSLWRRAPAELREDWVWWNVPMPPMRRSSLSDILDPAADNWDAPEYTQRLIDLMAPLHLRKVDNMIAMGMRAVGTLYRRTRLSDGVRVQRVEVRFDGISGCLRTPSGGSSRQRLLFVGREGIRSRLMTTREVARLMGIPEDYELPASYNKAYQIAGDGVAVPVVAWLAKNLLSPLMNSAIDSSAENEAFLLYA